MSNHEVLNKAQLNFDYFALLSKWLRNIRYKYYLEEKKDISHNNKSFYLETVEQRPSNKVAFY